MNIKVEPVWEGKRKDQISHFKARIRDIVVEPVPIKFMRVSELASLELMLQLAAGQVAEAIPSQQNPQASETPG